MRTCFLCRDGIENCEFLKILFRGLNMSEEEHHGLLDDDPLSLFLVSSKLRMIHS